MRSARREGLRNRETTGGAFACSQREHARASTRFFDGSRRGAVRASGTRQENSVARRPISVDSRSNVRKADIHVESTGTAARHGCEARLRGTAAGHGCGAQLPGTAIRCCGVVNASIARPGARQRLRSTRLEPRATHAPAPRSAVSILSSALRPRGRPARGARNANASRKERDRRGLHGACHSTPHLRGGAPRHHRRWRDGRVPCARGSDPAPRRLAPGPRLPQVRALREPRPVLRLALAGARARSGFPVPVPVPSPSPSPLGRDVVLNPRASGLGFTAHGDSGERAKRASRARPRGRRRA